MGRTTLPRFVKNRDTSSPRSASEITFSSRKFRARFDVSLTIDKGFEFEHNLKNLSFGVIVLETANNQMPSYERVSEELVWLIQCVAPGQVVRTSDPQR
jgi:hypothetical protein